MLYLNTVERLVQGMLRWKRLTNLCLMRWTLLSGCLQSSYLCDCGSVGFKGGLKMVWCFVWWDSDDGMMMEVYQTSTHNARCQRIKQQLKRRITLSVFQQSRTRLNETTPRDDIHNQLENTEKFAMTVFIKSLFWFRTRVRALSPISGILYLIILSQVSRSRALYCSCFL